MKNISTYSQWPVLLVFVVFIFGIALVGIVDGDEDVSAYERRDLAQFPELALDRILEGDFTEDYVAYLQDQSPFRDGFRFLKSGVSRNLLLNPENNGVFVVDGMIFDRFSSINITRIERASRVVGEIAKDVGSDRTFIAVLPTKGQALSGTRYHVADQSEITRQFEGIEGVATIDLLGLADLATEGAYYRSDPHWSALGVLWSYGKIAAELGLDPKIDFESELFTDSYLGGEYGKATSSSIEADSIYLPHNDVIDGLNTCRYSTLEETDCVDSVYYRGAESHEDAYDVFLGGLGPIIEITNPSASTQNELVVFKDSYSHAVAPLLAQHYSKVTLFDLRYMRRSVVLDNFDLGDSTVLFLYSTSVLNTDPQIVN
jgi:hypothetical protein